MEYDEIRISTRREIAVCRAAIRKLEQMISGFETEYPLTGSDLFQDPPLRAAIDDAEMVRRQNAIIALERWKERLADHLRILEMQ